LKPVPNFQFSDSQTRFRHGMWFRASASQHECCDCEYRLACDCRGMRRNAILPGASRIQARHAMRGNLRLPMRTKKPAGRLPGGFSVLIVRRFYSGQSGGRQPSRYAESKRTMRRAGVLAFLVSRRISMRRNVFSSVSSIAAKSAALRPSAARARLMSSGVICFAP